MTAVIVIVIVIAVEKTSSNCGWSSWSWPPRGSRDRRQSPSIKHIFHNFLFSYEKWESEVGKYTENWSRLLADEDRLVDTLQVSAIDAPVLAARVDLGERVDVSAHAPHALGMHLDGGHAPLLAERPQLDRVVGAGRQAQSGVAVQQEPAYVVRVALELHDFGIGARIPQADAVLRRAAGQQRRLVVDRQAVDRVLVLADG